MPGNIDKTRLRAVLDLAIVRLFEDAQLLEAAGFEAEAEDSYSCGMIVKETRRLILSSRSPADRE
jgi:hypothetical protein